VSDITYIYLPLGFAYLAAILDIFSRKCIGWCLGKNIDAQLTLDALDMAIVARKHLGLSETIHHSDRGVQYASQAYTDRLKEFGIVISMSGKGNAYDNAFAESFIKTLKVEEVYINEYETFEEAYANIKHFIELVYNEKRLHSSIGYVPPNEFENEVLNIKVS
jgi:transposase InsO family protein